MDEKRVGKNENGDDVFRRGFQQMVSYREWSISRKTITGHFLITARIFEIILMREARKWIENCVWLLYTLYKFPYFRVMRCRKYIFISQPLREGYIRNGDERDKRDLRTFRRTSA